MKLFQVFYEDNDVWHTAGFEYANDGYEAIEKVMEAKIQDICTKTGKNQKEIKEETNFDFAEVTTVSGKTISKLHD